MGPAAVPIAVGLGAVTAYGGYKKHQAGKKLKKFGKRYEEEQIGLAEEYAQSQLGMGIAAQNAANATAHALAKQAAMMRAAALQSKEVAAKNAKLVLSEGEETLRRMANEHNQTEATAKNKLWSSGLLANRGSMKEFQASLKAENTMQRRKTDEAFTQQANVVREGGDIEAALLNAQAVGVGAGAAQAEAEGLAAYQNAVLAGESARQQARLSGDAYIAQGKSMMSGGLGDFALGIAGMAMPFAGNFTSGFSAFGHPGVGGGMNPHGYGVPHI